MILKNLKILFFVILKKMNEKTITRNQLLTKHKEILIQLFSLGATTEEVLTFLKKNNFTGITTENLTAFSKKKNKLLCEVSNKNYFTQSN